MRIQERQGHRQGARKGRGEGKGEKRQPFEEERKNERKRSVVCWPLDGSRFVRAYLRALVKKPFIREEGWTQKALYFVIVAGINPCSQVVVMVPIPGR
jgi:hypothetical protein